MYDENHIKIRCEVKKISANGRDKQNNFILYKVVGQPLAKNQLTTDYFLAHETYNRYTFHVNKEMHIY